MENKIVWLFTLTLIFGNRYSHGDDGDCRMEPRCQILRTHGLKAADCYDKKFANFPKCIDTDVEVIELSVNRIRKVTKSDLSRYNSLKFLYLRDNFLPDLDDETFTDLTSLSSLDLSLDSLSRVPPTIFQLPSLKTLVLSQNTNLNIAEAIEQAKPITSPLKLLDISLISTKNNPAVFPDFGTLPFLTILNITENHYISITPKHVAGLCNLKKFINNNATTDFDYICDCWIINKWLKEREVVFIPFTCKIPENKCSDKVLSEEDEKIYDQCQESYSQIQKSHRLKKIGVGIGIAVLVVLIIACISFFWIRRKRNIKKIKKGKENNDTQPDGRMLLNNQPNSLPPNSN